MDQKHAMKQSRKVKIAPESAVRVITQRVTDQLAVVIIDDKLMTDEHIQMLQNAVKELIKEECKDVVIDLSRVKRINSSGLGSLITIYSLISSVEGTLKIGGMNEFVKNVMNITKLNDIFEIFPTQEDAIKSYKI
jgi:anti-sigma B factor antagonist